MTATIIIALIGILGGVTGGLFGVGGGLVFVPLLILLRNFDPHLATGTSLAAIVPTALAAAINHSRSEMIDWKTAAMIALFAIVGAWVGAWISLKLDSHLLRRLYAIFLSVLALKLFFSK